VFLRSVKAGTGRPAGKGNMVREAWGDTLAKKAEHHQDGRK